MGPGIRTEPATPTDPCGINATPRYAFLSLHTAQPASTIPKTTQSKRTVAGVSRPTRRVRLPTHHTSLVAQSELAPSVTQMTRPRPSDSVRAIIESAVPSIRVETIYTIPTKRLLRAFKVKLADERTLLLNILPPPSRLLRYEKWVVKSEAALVKWLLQDACEQQSQATRYLDEKRAGKRPQGESELARRPHQPDSDTLSLAKGQLRNYLPTLITHSSTPTETGSAFSLFEPTPGDPISSLGKLPTPAERRSLNFQKGRLIRHIANVTSPNGKFGQAATVLEPPEAPESSQAAARETKLDFDGVHGWRETFHLLLEGILRDGEDRAVTISYELVRTTFNKFSHLLDAVTTPRLVVCNADEDDVVLVSRSERGQEPEAVEEGRKAKMEPDDDDGEALGGSQAEAGATALKITGLQDWSNCLFGDPLFATVFSHPTPEFERGFRSRASRETHRMRKPHEPRDVKKEDRGGSGHDADDEDEEEEEEGEEDVEIIEDPDNAPTRVLLSTGRTRTAASARSPPADDESTTAAVAPTVAPKKSKKKKKGISIFRAAGAEESPEPEPKPSVEEVVPAPAAITKPEPEPQPQPEPVPAPAPAVPEAVTPEAVASPASSSAPPKKKKKKKSIFWTESA
ncbi:hypothetical protein EKO27_g10834 [Xylaria grammica]|uniref:Uncharacterized protein n=1 Tax=Xylaria grammica TaxID=363999 RepID=A0A439CQ35_9PEZI|nr:hypothetical protein EKO27_g10834 [Xylaria grammica]